MQCSFVFFVASNQILSLTFSGPFITYIGGIYCVSAGERRGETQISGMLLDLCFLVFRYVPFVYEFMGYLIPGFLLVDCHDCPDQYVVA